ncbi:hypothetical protein, variant 1 [Aphanomyces astaci]|uniref:Uncharacterized protein n=1 Tax=Aphanomyces astaci TaxID=112090 RepID=W4GFT2_APHAT|nr:hypothetical protein, variant 1 [Aphanomyces astaci]ETV77833.1 hypothetical protein, variant 1 [Aphanomyces astaci]|eukprot:XP_009832943.1 hypothetical protein, variant 1 [Aphanomyces astaci]
MKQVTIVSPSLAKLKPPSLNLTEAGLAPATPASPPSPASSRPPTPRPASPRMKPLRPVQRALLVDFLYREVFGIMDIKESDGPHNQQRVVDFFKSFVEMEKLVIYGLVLCVDSFLYVFTYLPLRIILALGSAVVSVFYTRIFRRSHVHDLLTAVIVILSTGVLMQVDMSRVYHLIRNQALIKLYVLFTMLEIFDKLFSSLGQDVLDAMYFTVRYQPRRVGRMMFDFAVCSIYVVLHSLLLFGQVVTINVAIHSSSSSLMTLLISNNFAELKSSVFKKFEEQNLFQVACSDIVERFKLMVIIGLILVQVDGKDVADGTFVVLAAEMLIDWIKHAFISKFNQIPPSVYSKFLTVLCRDVSGYRSDTTFLDHSQFVSRRLGLISLPLACVVLRMLFKALRDFDLWSQLYTPSGMSIALLGFANLSAFKVHTLERTPAMNGYKRGHSSTNTLTCGLKMNVLVV